MQKSYRAVGLSGLWRRSPLLGQSSGVAVISVTDPLGRPFAGIPVTVGGILTETDAHGVATLALSEVNAGSVEIVVDSPPYRASKRVDRSDFDRGTVFFQLPVCGPQSIVKPAELLALVAGALGSYYGWRNKVSPIQVAGEILLGASAFSLIYRHTC